ncbi:hypothetical protein NRY65_08950, partial [Acidithiobacillus ferrooxidans]|uniref:hypothetical protein n=1 Tax=Acidithiobacillus ferrooxidans TaxID=920 RepID=UPI002148D970
NDSVIRVCRSFSTQLVFCDPEHQGESTAFPCRSASSIASQVVALRKDRHPCPALSEDPI